MTALTEAVTPEMIKAERPSALRAIFTLPMQIDANCLSSTCGDGMHLSGDAVMVVDLDQRLITLHQFDLRDMNYMHHLSGMMQLRLMILTTVKTHFPNPCCPSATPDRVYQFDPDATLLLHEVDLENKHAIIDFEASMADGLFLNGSGVTTGNQLE